MTLAPGTRVGPYEIVGSLGAGGMGEVYRGRDLRLGRDVAVKVLPALFAGDAERRTRFDREARTLASLNHPNIAHIYGAEDAADTVAIVMELVEGEDLATRIARGPMTWAEAQPIARQIAEALDAAHEKGIVHRDLKPANIRITADEQVKVLDFGLAKALGGDAPAADPAFSPTFTSPGTQLGMIVGTAAYMAPEQAKGKAVDRRADIWAFGVVLFEMLTGQSPFAAPSAVESLGLIVMKDPEWTLLPGSVPRGVIQLLERCLDKDPKGRLRDIGDALPALSRSRGSTAEIPIALPSGGRRRVPVMLVAAGVLAAVSAYLAWTFKPAPSVPLRQLDLPPAVAEARSVAISPDGARVAYVSQGRIFVRELDQPDPRELTPTHVTTAYLVWSPDGRALAFYADGSICTIPAAGGPVFTVSRVPASGRLTGMTWHPDDRILFTVWRDSLYRVAASGGPAEVLLKVNSETEVDFHGVDAVPGNRLLISVHTRGGNQGDFEIVDLADVTRRTVIVGDPGVRDIAYAAPGVLLYERGGENQGIWATPFLDGKPNLANSVRLFSRAAGFGVSGEGTLLVQARVPPKYTFEWLGRDGSSVSLPGAPIEELTRRFAVSPGGDRVAFIAGRTEAVLSVRDLATGLDTRLVTDASGSNVALGSIFSLMNPAWFPSGDRLLYARGRVEAWQLVAQRDDGGTGEVPITDGTSGEVSGDGKWFVWLEDQRGQGVLRFAALQADGTLGEKHTLSGLDKVSVQSFDLSPDGQLIAFSGGEPGRQGNVWLASFPNADARWQATTSGGTFPRFSTESRELFFMSGTQNPWGAFEGRLMVMPVAPGPPLKLGAPRVWLSGDAAPNGFDVARDGRLLVGRRVKLNPEDESRAVLIQNWPQLMNSK